MIRYTLLKTTQYWVLLIKKRQPARMASREERDQAALANKAGVQMRGGGKKTEKS
jgi:hypothetical protein